MLKNKAMGTKDISLKLDDLEFEGMTTIDITVFSVSMFEKIVNWFQTYQFQGKATHQASVYASIRVIGKNFRNLESIVNGRKSQLLKRDCTNVRIGKISYKAIRNSCIAIDNHFFMNSDEMNRTCPVYLIKLVRQVIISAVFHLKKELHDWENTDLMDKYADTIEEELEKFSNTAFKRCKLFKVQQQDTVRFEVNLKIIPPNNPVWNIKDVPFCFEEKGRPKKATSRKR